MFNLFEFRRKSLNSQVDKGGGGGGGTPLWWLKSAPPPLELKYPPPPLGWTFYYGIYEIFYLRRAYNIIQSIVFNEKGTVKNNKCRLRNFFWS